MLSIMWVTIFFPILCEFFVVFSYFAYFPGSFFHRSPSQERLDRRTIKFGQDTENVKKGTLA